jgi:hypothetical protein
MDFRVGQYVDIGNSDQRAHQAVDELACRVGGAASVRALAGSLSWLASVPDFF